MKKRRFVPPAREQVDAARFSHPIFSAFSAFLPWMQGPDWPSLAQLNAALPLPARRFVAQDRDLLADGLHYELRIAEHGAIATRLQNWHDLFNAMIWCRYPAIKQALNARQCAHIAQVGPKTRNRAQYALTQFDEAGVIVQIHNPALLDLWDRHDWEGLFHRQASAWQRGDIRLAAVIGHALLEHALIPAQFTVGKALVLRGGDPGQVIETIAAAIAGDALHDPQQLRPLPLAGIPGWFPGQHAAFYRDAPCFQPLRDQRRYPPALIATQAEETQAGTTRSNMASAATTRTLTPCASSGPSTVQ